MEYRIKRGDAEFGPYNLQELQQYVQSGNVALDDLALGEGMSDWVPVGQVLGDVPLPPSAPVIDPSLFQPQVDLPPNLHWALLLLLSIVTCGYFAKIWTLIQANWARKLAGNNSAMVLMVTSLALSVVGTLIRVGGAASHETNITALGGLLTLVGAVCLIVGNFKIRSEMEDFYGISLGPVMTFFFGTLYIQYHVNELVRQQQARLLESLRG